jgi:erythromycin esterase-like protein
VIWYDFVVHRIGHTALTTAAALILFLAALGMTGCASPASARVQNALDAAVVTFAPGTVPDALVEYLSPRRVVLLGETHYAQEHQELVLKLLERLHPHGLRWFAQEMSHAYGWIVEDYVLLEREDYPNAVRRMDQHWIEGLRRFNRSLEPEDRIRFRYIDMNHAPDGLTVSLWWMVRGTTAGQEIYPVVEQVLETIPESEEYVTALDRLSSRLVEEADTLSQRLGNVWYERLVDLVEIEIRSLPIRARRDVQARERIMIDLSMQIIDAADAEGVGINVGMYHAQKRRYMGTRQQWLGEYLVRHAERFGGRDALASVAFFGFDGVRLRSFMDRDPEPVPPAIERPERNLMRQIAERTASRDGTERPQSGAYVELSHRLFQCSMPIAFTFSPLRAAPGRQFDAYVIFPELSILESIRRSWE